jgi:multidrug efflux pump subunit AcrA (membrane-fusion protein)
LELSGEVRARVEARLGFRLSGKLAKRMVEVGQSVKVGQVLAQLDPSDLQLAVDSARAQAEAARTQRDLAAADFKRFQALKEQNFISGAELERRDAALKAAQAQLDQAQAQLAVQSNQAAYTSLRADASGVVTAVEAEVGQVLAAGATVLRGICGFGANRVYHTQKLLDLSADMPIVIEAVDSQEKINAIMPQIDAMMGGGMITLEKATVIRYTSKSEK